MADKINNSDPPRWAISLLRWFCREDLVDAIEGDLIEVFERRVQNIGLSRARLMFALNVLMFFRPFALKRWKSKGSLSWIELQIINLRFAIRNLKHSFKYSLINSLSLTIGLTACGIMVSFIAEELSFDRFHKDGDRIYRFGYQLESENQTTRQLAWVSALVGPTALDTYPEIEHMVRMRSCGGTMIASDRRVFLEEGGFFAGEEFFSVFSFTAISGNLVNALDEPYEVVLTESMAKKYFGNTDPIGQVLNLQMRDTLNLKISAVIADVPAESHFTFDYLISHKTRELLYPHIQGWFALGTHTYIKLQKHTDIGQFNQKVQNMVMDYYGEEAKKLGFKIKLFTQRLWDIHLDSDLGNEIASNESRSYVQIAEGIVSIIFLISAFNFFNLSLARSVRYVKQIVVKQVMGAYRHQLIHQYITENMLLVIISFIAAIILTYVFLPAFGELVSRDLSMVWVGLFSMTSLGGLALFVGLLAGTIPAARILAIRSITQLKGSVNLGRWRSWANQPLIIIQFIMATVLIGSVLVINRQMNFMLETSLGFNKEQVAIIDLWNNREARNNTSILKTELLNSPLINAVTASNSVPGEQLLNRVGYPNQDESKSKVMFSLLVQEDFLNIYGLRIIKGVDNFSKENSDHSKSFVINETAVKEFGWTIEEAVGQDFQWGGRVGKIVGVIKDFHYYSLHEQIPPVIILTTNGGAGLMSVKFNGKIREAVDYTADVWERLYPTRVFNLTFLDDRFNGQYQQEAQLKKLLLIFSAVAIIIACAGLFSLSAFHVEQRIKEIGIRKLLGASVSDIGMMISAYFLKLVGLAAFISLPLIYYLTHNWLNGFAYRVELSPIVFCLAVLILFSIAICTVSIQSIRAAKLDPVENLRYE